MKRGVGERQHVGVRRHGADRKPILAGHSDAHAHPVGLGVDRHDLGSEVGEVHRERSKAGAEIEHSAAGYRARAGLGQQAQQQTTPVGHEGRVGVERAVAGRRIKPSAGPLVVLNDLVAQGPSQGREARWCWHFGDDALWLSGGGSAIYARLQMPELWTAVAHRLLVAVRPSKLLDVGDDDPAFTEAVCTEARRWDGDVVSIRRVPARRGDPPNLDVRARYTRGSILSVGPTELVVLHGEPNWWTTRWQLEAIGLTADRTGAPLPPVVVANAGAPWGRRDCYLDPNEIPTDSRQPHRRDGDRWVALDEGTPQNGVMTAVEEFARDRGGLQVSCIPGLGGVAVVLDPDAQASLSDEARALLDELRLSPQALALLEAVDAERRDQRARADRAAEAAASRDELRRELEALRRRVTELASQLAAERARAERAQARAAQMEQLRPGPLEPLGQGPTPSRNGSGPASDGAGRGALSEEPTRALIREILRPADLVRGLGWPGGEPEIALPIPVDHRGVIVPDAARGLVVLSDGDPTRLRQTLCTILDRVTEPIALTVLKPDPSSTELDRLWATLDVAVPAIELTDAVSFRPRPGTQRLIAGEELPWGWPDERGVTQQPSIAYLLPGIPPEGSGGAHSVVQEARGLRALGAEAVVCMPAGAVERAQRLYGGRDSLFSAYRGDHELVEAVGGATIAVATEHTSVGLLARLARARPDLACAYYVQDYEPLFAELGSPRSDRALLSYGAVPGAALFAKTHFIRNVITARHGVAVAKVSPSLDRALFNTEGRSLRVRRRLTVIALLRPRTPRRRPRATLAALALIAAALGEDVELVSFGCERSELDTAAHPELADLRHLGRLRSSEVADELRRSDVFIDGSAYQAFGRGGLEAMACGAVPVLPSLGGVREYAVDGANSVVLDDDHPQALADAVTALFGDRARLQGLRAAGVGTAASLSIVRAAQSQLDLFNWLQRRAMATSAVR